MPSAKIDSHDVAVDAKGRIAVTLNLSDQQPLWVGERDDADARTTLYVSFTWDESQAPELQGILVWPARPLADVIMHRKDLDLTLSLLRQQQELFVGWAHSYDNSSSRRDPCVIGSDRSGLTFFLSYRNPGDARPSSVSTPAPAEHDSDAALTTTLVERLLAMGAGTPTVDASQPDDLNRRLGSALLGALSRLAAP